MRIPFFAITFLLIHSSFSYAAEEINSGAYIRLSGPEVLSYEDCVELLRVDRPTGKVAEKLNRLVRTPFVSNEAFYNGAQPPKRIRPQLGQYLRVGLWNIERGMRLDEIILALKDPTGFQKYLQENESKGASDKIALEEAFAFSQSDVMALTELDYGVPRTDYRFVAKELADAIQMNYVYGTEFIEIDP